MTTTPAHCSNKTGYVDKESGPSQAALVARVDEIVRGLHARGKPKTLSVAHLGKGCATAAGGFGLSTIGQSVQ